MQLKYIRTKFGFTIWPDMTLVFHKHMAELTKEPVISAGFCICAAGHFTCYGESESLGIKSKGMEDSDAMNEFFRNTHIY